MLVKSNALNLSLLLLVTTFEISFTKSWLVNAFIVILCLLFLLVKKSKLGVLGLLLLPLIPALSTYWAVFLHGSGAEDGWLLVSRAYAMAALGMTFAFGVDLEELLLVLEQRKVPVNFVYGIMVVIHALPHMQGEIKALKEASLLRGKRLTIFSPQLYLKTIFVAFNWRDQYTEAMSSRGFADSHERALSQRYYTPWRYLLVSLSLFISGNGLLLLSF